MSDQFITIDGIKWWVSTDINGVRTPQPICPIHHLRLRPTEDIHSAAYNFHKLSHTLKCEDCKKHFKIPRSIEKEKQYVTDKLDSKIFKSMRFINLDDEAIPIAKDKKIPKDNKYFVRSILTDSKTGKRLVVYAGLKGKKEKTQIFVEPEIRRLSFDQNNLHPTDVFTKLEATFSDGTKAIQKKKK